jgi:hypothetical protein
LLSVLEGKPRHRAAVSTVNTRHSHVWVVGLVTVTVVQVSFAIGAGAGAFIGIGLFMSAAPALGAAAASAKTEAPARRAIRSPWLLWRIFLIPEVNLSQL